MAEPGDPPHALVEALNARFARIAGFSYDHRWWVVATCVALLAGAMTLAGQVRIDNSYEAYFDPGDPAFLAYERYRDDFGSDEVSYILYEAPDHEHGPWNLEIMRRVDELTRALEDEVPFIYEVKSLTNAELTIGVPDGIEISKLSDGLPATQQELLDLRAQYLSKPMLVGGIASADGTHGAIIIKMDRSSTDPPEAIRLDPAKGDALENLYPQVTDDAIEKILARPEYSDLRFYHSGDVPLNAIYNRVIAYESPRLDFITSCVIAALLLLTFRSFVSALAPIAVVQLCVIFCVAFIALLGWKLDMGFGSIPTLLTAIGVAHSVHILSEFRTRYARLGDRREALVQSMHLVGTPCLMTSLTTAVGFGSMAFVPIKSIAHSGAYGAFGVMAAFVMSVTLLMALLSMARIELAILAALVGLGAGYLATAGSLDPAVALACGVGAAALAGGLTLALFERRGPPRGGKGGALTRDVLLAIAAFDVRHRRAILASFGALFVLSGIGITRLIVDSNWLDDFSDKVPLKAVIERVDRVMGGTTNVIYLFDAGESEGIKEPAVLREMKRVQEIAAEHQPLVRKSYSLVDVLEDLNQVFHGGDPAHHVIPESRELVAQYLILYESSGGEETEEYVSADYRRASVELRLALAPTRETAKLVARIDAALEGSPLEASSVELTGIGALWLKLMDYIVSSQILGFTLAFVVIAAMMVAIFRSLSTGLISMVPNLSPVLLALGVMGWSGVFLDYSKITIAAVAIGIAVDDTIHLVSRYRYEFGLCGDYVEALRRALVDVGRALLITSAALVCGFLVLVLSVLDSQATYGILLATTIVSALIADFLLMPALVLTFHPFGPEGAQRTEARVPEAA